MKSYGAHGEVMRFVIRINLEFASLRTRKYLIFIIIICWYDGFVPDICYFWLVFMWLNNIKDDDDDHDGFDYD